MIPDEARRLLLLSASPRRRQLLQEAGYSLQFDVHSVPEPPPAPGESGEHYASRMARIKWHGPATAGKDDPLRLSADTVVVVAGAIFGKPEDLSAARAMLERLSDSRHEVWTAIAMGRSLADVRVRCSVAEVRFAVLHATAMAELLADTPQHYAGGYAIQGAAGRYAQVVRGSLDTIIGLSAATVAALQQEFLNAAPGAL